jgi:hypothetical protein
MPAFGQNQTVANSENQGSHFSAQRQKDSPKIIDAKPKTSPIPSANSRPPNPLPPPAVPTAYVSTRASPATNPQPNLFPLDSVSLFIIFHGFLTGCLGSRAVIYNGSDSSI